MSAGSLKPCTRQAELLSGGTSGDDAFAELVRLAIQRDPSLAHSDTSTAISAAHSAAGPPPDSATGAVTILVAPVLLCNQAALVLAD